MSLDISARLYSLSPLDSTMVGAVEYGLSLVANHTGSIEIVGQHMLKLAMSGDVVDLPNVGYEKLPPGADIHMFVAPLGEGEATGFAVYGRGVVWLNTSSENIGNGNAAPYTAAHEVAHSIGFLMDGAKQALKDDKGHCSCDGCIMEPTQLMRYETSVQSVNANTSIFRRRKTTEKLVTEIRLSKKDFCGNCAVDMRSHAAANVTNMRLRRIRTGGKVLLNRQVKELFSQPETRDMLRRFQS